MANTSREPDRRPTAVKAIRVTGRGARAAQGWLTVGPVRIAVALGRSGIRADKREGDGATPWGRFRPVRLWWRADRGLRPRTSLPIRRISRFDGWCENPADHRYNRPIRVPGDGSGDRLWRADHLYDLVVELDHNSRPRVAGRGSAIFIHVARPGLAPTAGCVALPATVLRRLLMWIGRKTRIEIR
jgi:L,D-peptidoglycan transpeptidase YkuD (ErfK/YbiS/YcfS/YnhG family)